MTEETVYLTPQQAARILGLSVKTLARYRVKAKGPVFVKLEGRVRYLRKDLDEWVIGRRRASTMDDGTVLTGAGQREAGRESATRRAWRSSRPSR